MILEICAIVACCTLCYATCLFHTHCERLDSIAYSLSEIRQSPA